MLVSRIAAMLCCALVPCALAQSSGTPAIGAIANAGSYAAGSVSPGEIVTLFGSNMGPDVLVGLVLDANGNVATNLAGTSVLFDGTPAPLI